MLRVGAHERLLRSGDRLINELALLAAPRAFFITSPTKSPKEGEPWRCGGRCADYAPPWRSIAA